MNNAPEDKGPWQRKSVNRGTRRTFGGYLWFGLLVVIGLGIWLLFVIFPDHASSEDTYIRVFYMVALLAFISSGLLYARRIEFRKAIRNIAIWAGVVVALLAGYTYQTEFKDIFYRISGELIPGQAVHINNGEIIITANIDGHYYSSGEVNGQSIRFLIDTGASGVVLSPRDAARIGIKRSELKFTQKFQTANGIGYGAMYRLDRLSVGFLEMKDIRVSINQADMSNSLLGMSFLKGFKSFEFRDRKLYLRR